jgi:spore germination protein YaaH
MKRLMPALLILLLLGASSVAGYWYTRYNDLSSRFAETFYRSGVTVDEVVIPSGMTYQEHEGRLYLDVRIVQGWMDEGAYLSPSGERLYLQFDTMDFKSGDAETDTMLQENLNTLSLPIYVAEGEKYIELEGLARLYRLSWTRNLETGIINILTPRGEVFNLEVARRTAVTVDGIKVFEMKPEETWKAVLSEEGGYAVIHPDGRMGQLSGEAVLKAEAISVLPEPRRVSEKPVLNQLIGAWDQVHRYDHNFNFKAAEGAGVGNVIMPTWFDLNVDGIVLNLADTEYVRSAREAGWQVWGLYANHFSPAWTSEMMRDETLADRTIAHVVAYAVAYDLDGINIDFENMYLRDKDAFTAYVAKLSAALHRVGKWVSVDVTVPWGSDQWSRVYDRPALSKLVDYVFLMAYDEHWAASPTAGSVASRDWVVRGIEESLKLIPREKLILGMPLYTRIWEETGSVASPKVSSSTLSYQRTTDWLAEKGLTPGFDPVSGQNYAEYTTGSSRFRVWLEDRTSLEMRLELMKKYQLPGLGFWSIDFANEEVWEIIDSR